MFFHEFAFEILFIFKILSFAISREKRSPFLTDLPQFIVIKKQLYFIAFRKVMDHRKGSGHPGGHQIEHEPGMCPC